MHHKTKEHYLKEIRDQQKIIFVFQKRRSKYESYNQWENEKYYKIVSFKKVQDKVNGC